MIPRCGFTFIETLCVLLVATAGLLGALGLVSWGLGVASQSQGKMTGLATAVSVTVDPRPMRSLDWTYTPYAFDDMTTPELSSTATGYLNGYWVVRTETTAPRDIIAKDGPTVYARSALIAVDVFEAEKGKIVATYQARVVRQRGESVP